MNRREPFAPGFWEVFSNVVKNNVIDGGGK